MSVLCLSYVRPMGKTFAEAENGPHACTFHPGGPVFHEGLKGWSCCKKRVVDFEEFMAIEGCATGKESGERSNMREREART